MSTVISAGTTTNTAYNVNADTSGSMVLATGSGPTTAVTIDSSQNTTLAGSLNAPNTFGFKNRIINGAMVIDQRAAGASFTPTVTTALTYGTCDRWAGFCFVASKFSMQQSTTAPAGFANSLKITSASAYTVGASESFNVVQAIEGFNTADLSWGTANAKTVTLSFQVYSSLTGTFGGSIQNSASNRSYPFTYTVSSANTWTSISVTIAGDTSGTWLTTNGVGMYVWFGLGTGSTYSGTAGSWAGANYFSATGATSVVGTNGATFYITGVQLEKGSTATSFDYRPYGTELALCQTMWLCCLFLVEKGSTATSFDYRPYGTELALCQRYAFVTDGSSGTTGAVSNGPSGYANQRFVHPIPMRSAPAITVNTSGTWVLSNDYSADYTATTVGVVSYSASTQSSRVQLSGFSGLPSSGTFVDAVPGSGTGKLIFSSEL